MIKEHRPYWLKKLMARYEHWYCERYIAPQLAALGPGYMLLKPWNLRIYGSQIRAGKNLHIITTGDRWVCFSTWALGDAQGQINLGDNLLICPGSRFDSASAINIGDNCMFAAGVYVTDADWHDIYDRTRAIGTTRPVTLAQNVWVGDGAIICKGVTIGENSVIGAGSVVTGDIPANVIAAGNPARVIKPLDATQSLVTREQLFADPRQLRKDLDRLERHMLKQNSLWDWLRAHFFPKRGD